jgi:hypothetical protein
MKEIPMSDYPVGERRASRELATAADQSPASVDDLIRQLSSPSAVVRERAREALVALGHTALTELMVTLESANEHARWEACKALAEIADPASIRALIRALESEHQDVRWVAAEGLVNIGSESVEPLLIALIDRAFGHTILAGGHHVLHACTRRTPEPVFEALLAAMRGPQPGVHVPPAAEVVLMKWRELAAEVASGRRWYLLRPPRPIKPLPKPLL